MPVQKICPHCDSPRVQPMDAPAYDGSTVMWYQCQACRRMWSLEKPPAPAPSDSDSSPES
jgi:hypothetical protein